MNLPVAILAGGLATRLRPITEKIPKSLVDVAGKPFIVRQLEYLHQQGIRQVVLCLGYLGDQVKAVVGDGSAFGLEVRYSWDGEHLMGTGGALKRAAYLLGDRCFVYYGDSYLPIDFKNVAQAYQATNQPALMTVLCNNNQWDVSNVQFQGGRVIEYNKRKPKADMEYIDYGLGILALDTLDPMPDDESFDLADVYHHLSIQGKLAGLEVFERFYEIGSHQGLMETINMFKKKDKQ